MLSLFLYGFSPSVFTTLVAGIGIVARSGNVISATMKVSAELSTVIGVHIGRNIFNSSSKYLSWILGLLSRILIMTIVNLYVLPSVYGVPMSTTIRLLPLIGVFNALQGLITIGLGDFLFDAVQTRFPRWAI
jgi:hypothetical protein